MVAKTTAASVADPPIRPQGTRRPLLPSARRSAHRIRRDPLIEGPTNCPRTGSHTLCLDSLVYVSSLLYTGPVGPTPGPVHFHQDAQAAEPWQYPSHDRGSTMAWCAPWSLNKDQSRMKVFWFDRDSAMGRDTSRSAKPQTTTVLDSLGWIDPADASRRAAWAPDTPTTTLSPPAKEAARPRITWPTAHQRARKDDGHETQRTSPACLGHRSVLQPKDRLVDLVQSVSKHVYRYTKSP